MSRGSSNCFRGSQFLDLCRWFLHPSLRDFKAVPFSILMTDAFGRPTAYGIDYVNICISMAHGRAVGVFRHSVRLVEKSF